MEENSKKRCLNICRRWICIAKDSETIKHIFSVMDTIGGTKIQEYIDDANKFLEKIKQTDEVKEIRNEIRKNADRGLSLF